MNYREKMREYLKEPNEICNHYGKWGILNREQRDLITRLLNEMDGADNYIIKLHQENARLKDKIEKIEEWLKYKAEALDTFDISKRKKTGAFWFTTRGEIDGLLELLKEN